MSTADVHEEEVESRYEATFAVLIVIALQATLAAVTLGNGWTLNGLPGWVWLIPVVPEAALLLVLSWSLPRHRLEQLGRRRTVALVLVGVITAADATALVALIAWLLSGHERSGGELLLKGRHDLGFGKCRVFTLRELEVAQRADRARGGEPARRGRTPRTAART